MALIIILAILMVASVLFHLLSPWKFTEIASDWGAMDTMFNISMAVTGLVFVLVTSFMIYALYKYRHREGHKAEFEPDDKRLEWWLTGLTTLGIVILLAPGLVVYNRFVQVPEEAIEIEVVGEQWQFSFRYPGADGRLGIADVRHMSFDNPFGLDPDDPAGRDDILVRGNALHLPKDQPVKLLLRSKDVLHSVFVPQFRAKMDMVPGMVTHFWLTPTRAGEYEILCSQHCGVGHFNMRANVVVLPQAEFDAWLAQQQTFGDALAQIADRDEDPAVTAGRALADSQGCFACHSMDGSRRIGPTWAGLYGSDVRLTDGSTVLADAAYIKRSIVDPNAQITQGYAPVMMAYRFTDTELDALVAFIASLADAEAAAPPSEPSPPASEATEPTAALGRQVSENNACFACHSVDGSPSVGPTWKGLYGKEVTLADGSSVIADAAYIALSITDPAAQLTAGYPPVMPPANLSDTEIEAVIAYIRELSHD